VARILICEPHAEVRALLGHVVSRLGHEAVYPAVRPGAPLPDDVHLVLLEPADPQAEATVRALLRRNEELPVVCVSIYPPSSDSRLLGPVVHIVKPFGLSEVELALETALDGVTLAA
jgi:hypothetical protein